MDRAQLYKLTELIVAEVVRRIAQEERRRQHPEQGARAAGRQRLLPGEAAADAERAVRRRLHACEHPGDEHVCRRGPALRRKAGAGRAAGAGEGGQNGHPRLAASRAAARIASGDDGDPLSHLLVRAILWQKDVRVYLDYEPPRFRRNTFLADTAEAIDTLRQMAVTVCPYFAVAPQEPEGTDLVTEADVLDAAKTESKTIRCRSGAIITPAARDALAATDVILRYEGETTHAAS